MQKTEICAFSLNNEFLNQARELQMIVDNKLIKYNPNPKLLGVTLDEKMKFDKHIENVERKGLKAVEALRHVKEIEKISTKCMLQLYKALVIPQLEYAAQVWQVGNCAPLEKVQRKGLALCLGTPGTAGLDALEVEAGVVPLQIRREELSIRQAARIIRKDDTSFIKVSWNTFVDSEKIEKKISPFGMMLVQMADMTTETEISFRNLEKELNYHTSLQPTRTIPEYWQKLGSSKSRSTEQELLSRQIIEEKIDKCTVDTAIAFTDGSCLTNPGPCGAGACIFIPGQEQPELLKQPVTNRGSILLGELIAIKLAIDHVVSVKTNQGNRNFDKLLILSDSQSAIGHLNLGWEPNAHKYSILDVKASIKNLEKMGTSVEIAWTPGHADIKGNESADKLAKEATKEAKELGEDELPAVTTLQDVKMAARKYGMQKWQNKWDWSETGRHLYELRPKVDFKDKHIYKTTIGEKIITQLRTGYVFLNEYLHSCRWGITESPNCQCGEKETVHHYLLHCPKYEIQRESLRRSLFSMCGITHLDAPTLLEARKKEEDEIYYNRDTILDILESYVVDSQRFATVYKF